MHIISASFKTEGGSKKLVLLLETDDKTQRWFNLLESNVKFKKAKELTMKYMESNSEADQVEIVEELLLLIDIKTRIKNTLKTDTSGVFTLKGSVIYYDGEALNQALSLHIIEMFNSDLEPHDSKTWNSFARFIENLQSNVSDSVRDQLFSWIGIAQSIDSGFTITEDGCFIAYKGCPVIKNGISYSGHSGNASVLKDDIVTDYRMERIPNELKTVVMMPRKEVTSNPNVECGPGLHVSTIRFARSYSRDNYVYTTKINPKDVVSIRSQKIRVARYEIIDLVQEKLRESIYKTDSENNKNAVTTNKDVTMKNTNDSKKLNNTQRGEIFAGLSGIGIERFERGRALRWISDAVDRKVESRNDLTVAEADVVLTKLKSATA